MEKFIKEVTDVTAKVIRCRISGKVIIATIESSEMKRQL